MLAMQPTDHGAAPLLRADHRCLASPKLAVATAAGRPGDAEDAELVRRTYCSLPDMASTQFSDDDDYDEDQASRRGLETPPPSDTLIQVVIHSASCDVVVASHHSSHLISSYII